jgi:UrcA family protein
MEVPMKKFLISAVLLSAAALSEPALAEPASPAPRITVQHRDLDLSTPAGRATLRSRVNAAVREVCRNRFDGGLDEIFGWPSCRHETKVEGFIQANRIIARANRTGVGLLAGR